MKIKELPQHIRTLKAMLGGGTLTVCTEHGGRIECESVAGKGTAFTIHLPLAEEV
jgi:signal transduction histidine kinase